MIPTSLDGLDISYLMILLHVAFKVSSVTEAFSTFITGVVTSCQIHPP